MVRASISQPYGREFDFHHPHIWGALYEYTSPLTSKLPNQKKKHLNDRNMYPLLVRYKG